MDARKTGAPALAVRPSHTKASEIPQAPTSLASFASSASPADSMDALLGAHSRFLACNDDPLTALDLTVRLEHLLAQGKGDLIEREARRIQAEGGDGHSLLSIAQDCACSLTESVAIGGRSARLFAIPLTFDDVAEVDGAPRACVEVIRQSLLSSGMVDLAQAGADVQMDEWLWTQADLSTLGLRDLHKILACLASDPPRPISVSPSACGPDTDSAWRAEVLGQPRHLRWLVGCLISSEQSEDVAGGSISESQMDSFMETASSLLSMELGMGVEVGLPATMSHQMRSGAFDEAANGLLDACHIGQEAEAGDLILRSMSLDDSVLGGQEDTPARCRLHLELILSSASQGDLQLARFDLDCDMDTASDHLEDLAAVLKGHGGVTRIDSVHHAFQDPIGAVNSGSSAQRYRSPSTLQDGQESGERDMGFHFWSEASSRDRNQAPFLH